MAKLNYTAAEIDALLEKVAANGDDIEAIIAAFPFALQRGEYPLNDQSELTFDTLTDTKYYRYTASAIGNPVSGGYGIIINIRYTVYAVQLLFSQTAAAAPTQLLYRIGTNMTTTPAWKAWQTVSTGSGGATITSLWSLETGAVVNTEYALNDNINNYDAIYLKISTKNDIASNNTFSTTSFLPQFYSTDQGVEWQGYNKRVITAKFDGDKFKQIISGSTGEGAGYEPKIYQIIGVKY